MKNKMTTTIDLNVLLAEVEKSIRNDESVGEHSVLTLTLEWELDIDHLPANYTPQSIDDGETDGAAATSNGEPDRQDPDDWQATVAQFPDD